MWDPTVAHARRFMSFPRYLEAIFELKGKMVP